MYSETIVCLALITIAQSAKEIEQMQANANNMDNIKKFLDKYPYHDNWVLSKVWLCQRTLAIKARFKNETIGSTQGMVVPNFKVKQFMTLEEIMLNVTLEILTPHQFIVDMFENNWEDTSDVL